MNLSLMAGPPQRDERPASECARIGPRMMLLTWCAEGLTDVAPLHPSKTQAVSDAATKQPKLAEWLLGVVRPIYAEILMMTLCILEAAQSV